MPFLVAAVPYLAAAGAVYQGMRQKQADQTNAGYMKMEQVSAIDQGVAQENIVRRQGREALGRQAAAFGGAGVGYGGSSEVALDTSAVNQELDALNTRYKGIFSGYGYGQQSNILNQEAGQQIPASLLLAGSQALRTSNYSFAPQSTSAAAMAGTPNNSTTSQGFLGPPAN